MHVVLNAQLISTERSYRSAGVSGYSRHLLRALGSIAAGDETLQLTALRTVPDLPEDGVHTHASPLPLYFPPARIAWEQLVLPGLLHHLHADLVHGLVNVLPLASNKPGVVTVHDLSFLHLPQYFHPSKRLYLTVLCRASVHRAARIIAVSAQTAKDVVEHFGVSPEKIAMVHNGVDARFSPGDPSDVAAFRAANELPERFFLYLGTLEPRKNLETLLRAYATWRTITNDDSSNVQLVIAGGKGWYYESVFALVNELGLQECVRFPGFVPHAELPYWYRAALGVVYPSVFEGFGLPVLEAMACGTPVLCSNIPALREVAGDAAITAPPHDIDGWVAGMTLLAGQARLRSELRDRGLRRAAGFTWDATARHTVAAYRRALLQ